MRRLHVLTMPALRLRPTRARPCRTASSALVRLSVRGRGDIRSTLRCLTTVFAFPISPLERWLIRQAMLPTGGRSSRRSSVPSSRFPKLGACITATSDVQRSSTPARLPLRPPVVPLFLLAILRAPRFSYRSAILTAHGARSSLGSGISSRFRFEPADEPGRHRARRGPGFGEGQPDGEVPRQDQSGSCADDIPRAHHRPQAPDAG